MADNTNLYQILNYLAGPAGITAWMIFISDILRNWDLEGKFSKFSALGKSLVNVGLAFGVPALAYTLINLLPKEFFDTIQPYFAFVATLFMAYAVQQGYFFVKSRVAQGTSTIIMNELTPETLSGMKDEQPKG